LVNTAGEVQKLTSKKAVLKLAEIEKVKTKDFMKANSITLDEWTDVQKVIEFNSKF
jgi:hypothetical protein